MTASLTVVRYPKYFVPFAVLSMAIFHLPLLFNKHIHFYKLMGCGKNGSFDKHPDWQQWAILLVYKRTMPAANPLVNMGRWINGWLQIFSIENWSIGLQPLEGHGQWDGGNPFTMLPQPNYNGPIAVLTRASIRWSKLGAFWRNVGGVARQMAGAEGFVTSIGIGEVPYIKQATFSVWQSANHMKNFAYRLKEHQQVIKKTRAENWYSEDLFMRFVPLCSFGTIKGANPLNGIV
jgi:hypothetical protein